MGFHILSESYGRRLPKITAEADSTDDFVALGTDYAEGSTCTVGEDEYVLDKVGGWVIPGSGGGEPFIVMLTPTAADYSGTMDKTIEEIYEAYQAGRQLVFRMMLGVSEYMDVDCTARYKTSYEYPSFNGYAVITTPITGLIYAWTGTTDDGTDTTYNTNIYTLTSAT